MASYRPGESLLREECALQRCVGLRIGAIHASPDDTTTASVYIEVSAPQTWCFTVVNKILQRGAGTSEQRNTPQHSLL